MRNSQEEPCNELPIYSYMMVSVTSSVVSLPLAFQSKQQQIIHII